VGTCADYAAPSCTRGTRAPTVTVARGTQLTFHLEFVVTDRVTLILFGDDGGGVRREVNLTKTNQPRWAADHDGPLVLFARAKQGDASYSLCVDLE
jgi:hypothetical protein